jgi:dipeptidyl aminopeptidase/acylaminoacyl peptidase
MTRIYIIILLITLHFQSFSQKPILNLHNIRNWPSLTEGKISSDGKFVSYVIREQPVGSNTLVVQLTTHAWKAEFVAARNASFSKNGKVWVYQMGDSLCLLNLLTYRIRYIPGVLNFDITQDDFLIYRTRKKEQELIIENLMTNELQTLPSVISYSIQPKGSLVIVEQRSSTQSELILMNLKSSQSKSIWSGNKINSLQTAWGHLQNKVAFLIQNQGQFIPTYQVWYCDSTMRMAREIPVQDIGMTEREFEISNNDFQFSSNDMYLLISLRKHINSGQLINSAAVDIWSYTDTVLQSEQLETRKKSRTYIAAINIHDNLITRIEGDNESLLAERNGYALVVKQLVFLNSILESYWNKSAQMSYFVVSLKDGERKLIKDNVNSGFSSFSLSPNGRWVVHYDFDQGRYFCYEMATGQSHAITESSVADWEVDFDENAGRQVFGVGGWMPNDQGVFLYSRHDIWLVNLDARRPALNWTNGLGKRLNTKFTFIDNQEVLSKRFIKWNSEIILKAFNMVSKEEGHYCKTLNSDKAPCLLNTGAYGFGSRLTIYNNSFGAVQPPVKAENSETYLEVRYSATEAPNYFVTKDFKSFNSISNIQPQKKFNWYTTELVKWKSPDGIILEGILYKPENFDSTKRYPVIFNYYEKRSNELNIFKSPIPSNANINIPLFVSSGYLVFTPDIHYNPGEAGKSAYNSIVSAANYLSQFSWVDRKRMGIQGHSFGGFETGYIVTHTDIFAAASAAAGVYDWVSAFGSPTRGSYFMYHAEKHQGRLKGMPWEFPDLFIANSPINSANAISTPLLMMHNKNDDNVSFNQGLLFFKSLRRLGKKSWMLQYDNGDHAIDGLQDSEDYHTRMMQFFDHYLKDSACPKWMLQGIPANMKGIEDGLELVKMKDANTGKWITPPDGGLLTEEEKKKVESLRKGKPITITFD